GRPFSVSAASLEARKACAVETYPASPTGLKAILQVLGTVFLVLGAAELPYLLDEIGQRSGYVVAAAIRPGDRRRNGNGHHYLQTREINKGQWVRTDVGVCINATAKADWVTLYVPADSAIVVTHQVVGEARLLVGILPRESQRKFKRTESRRIVIRRVDPERLDLIPTPDRLSGLVGNKARRVEMIDAYEIKRRRGCLVHGHVHRR